MHFHSNAADFPTKKVYLLCATQKNRARASARTQNKSKHIISIYLRATVDSLALNPPTVPSVPSPKRVTNHRPAAQLQHGSAAPLIHLPERINQNAPIDVESSSNPPATIQRRQQVIQKKYPTKCSQPNQNTHARCVRLRFFVCNLHLCACPRHTHTVNESVCHAELLCNQTGRIVERPHTHSIYTHAPICWCLSVRARVCL